MTVTPQLRVMLAERKDRAERTKRHSRGASPHRVMDAIDAAAPMLVAEDRGCTKFPRSTLIKIGYFVIATSGRVDAEKRAREFVRDSLAGVSEPA